MDFNRRLKKIEDKIEVSGKKVIRISNLADLIEYAHKKLPDDTEVILNEKITAMIENTIRTHR